MHVTETTSIIAGAALRAQAGQGRDSDAVTHDQGDSRLGELLGGGSKSGTEEVTLSDWSWDRTVSPSGAELSGPGTRAGRFRVRGSRFGVKARKKI